MTDSMLPRRLLLTGLLVGLAVSAPAQTTATTDSFGNYIASAYTIGTATWNSIPYDISLTVIYPPGQTADAYVTQAQFVKDIAAALSGYPTPQDPAEAVFNEVLASLLKKYPQIRSAELSGSFSMVDRVTYKTSYAIIDVFASQPDTPPAAAEAVRRAADRLRARSQSKQR